MIFELLYQVFIAPIEYIFNTVFILAHALCGNYGVSIILLSIVFNLLVLPIYLLADSLQEQDKQIREKLKCRIDRIKAHYKGNERHFYIKTIYRQNNYHPARAIKASLGLFIQVPFFIAAYQTLKHADQLQQVPWWFLQDLGSPDGLLFGWHLLPFAMLGVNLFASYLYTRKPDFKEHLQIWLLGLVFFIILYNEASALLLYWTCNNAFSLVKTTLLQHAHKITLPFIDQGHKERFQQLYTGNPKFLSFFSWGAIISGSLLGFYAIAGFLDAEQKIVDSTSLQLVYTYITITSVAFFLTNLLLYRKYLSAATLKNPFFSTGVLVTICISAGLFCMVNLVNISSLDDFVVTDSVKFIETLKKGVSTLLLCVYILLVISLAMRNWSWLNRERKGVNNFYLAVTLLVFITLILNPLVFFNASDQLIIPRFDFIESVVSVFFVSLACCWLVFILASNGLRTILLALTAYLLAAALLYNFIVVKDYGLLDQFVFITPEKLVASLTDQLIDITYLLLVAPLIVVLIFRFPLYAKRACFLTMISLLIYCALHLPQQNKNAQQSLAPSQTQKGYYQERAKTLAFSKEKNVLVLLFDGFSGITLNELLNTKRELFDEFDGFVWYKNTLSSGTNTQSTIAALAGGKNYTVAAMHARIQETNGSLNHELDQAYKVYAKAFTDAGWDVVYGDPQHVKNPSSLVHRVTYNYANRFLQQHQPEIMTSLDKSGEHSMLSVISLFRMLPLSFKQGFYDNGKWSGATDNKMHTINVYKKAKHWGFLHSLAEEMHFSSQNKALKYLQFQIPHKPNLINKSGLLGKERSSVNIESYMALTQVAKIIRKLKVQGVYDNTKIVLVSDHGQYGIYDDDFSIDFITSIPKAVENSLHISRVYPLLMVKDFKNRGPMQISNRFMSNFDLAGIVCSTLETRCNIEDRDQTRLPPGKRTLRVTRVTLTDKILFRFAYEVEGSIFQPENWRLLPDGFENRPEL